MEEDTPRVLVVSQMFPPETGGNASRMGDLTKHMSDDLDLTVIAPPPCFPASDFEWSWTWEQTEFREGHDVHRLWSWQLREVDPSFIERLLYYITFVAHAIFWLALRRKEFDVVLTTSPPIFTGMVAAPFSLLEDVKWVVDIRDLWIDVSSDLGFIDDDGLVTRLSHAYQEFELQQVDLITVTTDGTAVQLREEYGFDTDIGLVPNGVDTTAVSPVDTEVETDLIYTGNIGYAQELEVCIRALQYTEEDVTFQLVGDGDLRPELVELAAEVGVVDHVEFTGLVPREEIPRLISQSRIGIAPLKDRDSLAYAVPTKLFEYWACELPVLALGRGNIEELVDASGAGVVPQADPQAVASAIDSLMGDESRRASMGMTGQEFVVANYEREAIAKNLVRWLSQVSEDSNANLMTGSKTTMRS